MKGFVLSLWYMFLFALAVQGQGLVEVQDGELTQEESDGRQAYRQAEEAYAIGHFDECLQLLEHSIDRLDGVHKVSAYRLMSLSKLAQDNLDGAEHYALLLLKEAPYYNVSIHDPQRFVDLLERLKQGGEMTITTASQSAESLNEAPVPVTLITKEMITASGAQTLKELLITYVPGMSSIESNEEMNLAMRGIYSSGQEKFLILLDGHRLNSYSTNTSRPDFSMSLDKVKQIEVLRGPASSLYGGVALTAVVNIISLSGQEVNGAKIQLQAGNYGQLGSSFLFGSQYFDWNLMAWASVYKASGQKVTVPVEDQKGVVQIPGDIIIGGFNHQPSYDVGLKMKWKNLNLLYNTNFSKTVAPYTMGYFFAPYSYNKYRTFEGNAPGFAQSSHHLNATLEKQWNRFFLKAKINLDMDNHTRYQVASDSIPENFNYCLYPPGTDVPILITKGAFQYHHWQERTWGVAFQGNYGYEWNNHNSGMIIAGVQFERFSLNDSYYIEGDNYDRVLVTFDESKNLYTGKETSMNSFVQLKHKYNDWLVVNAGIRYDYKRRRNGKEQHEYSPRLAFILIQPTWSLRLSYAKSFVDAPYFYRNNTLDTTIGGENLLSEYLYSYQCSFMSKQLLSGLDLDINLFYNCATDFIIPDGMVYTNAGFLENMGIELSTAYTFRKLRAWWNFTWQHVLSSDKYKVKNHRVYNIPSVSSNLILSYPIWERLRIHSHWNMLSKQVSLHSIPGEDGNLVPNDIHLPARFIWNLGMIYQGSSYELGCDVHNLLNRRYEQGGTSVAPICQKGLWFDVKFSYNF